jgi:hypothetical protein
VELRRRLVDLKEHLAAAGVRAARVAVQLAEEQCRASSVRLARAKAEVVEARARLKEAIAAARRRID